MLQVGDLGVGAYATVEHCRLTNWRDDSHHGAAAAAVASAAAVTGAAALSAAADAAQPQGGAACSCPKNAAARCGAAGGGSVSTIDRQSRLRQRAALHVAVKVGIDAHQSLAPVGCTRPHDSTAHSSASLAEGLIICLCWMACQR